MKRAEWKRKEKNRNAFNAIVYEYVFQSYLDGELDTITTGSGMKAHKFSDLSRYVFITKTIKDVENEDVLTIEGIDYRVTYVDNPFFLNSHLEIELERIPKRKG